MITLSRDLRTSFSCDTRSNVGQPVLITIWAGKTAKVFCFRTCTLISSGCILGYVEKKSTSTVYSDNVHTVLGDMASFPIRPAPVFNVSFSETSRYQCGVLEDPCSISR